MKRRAIAILLVVMLLISVMPMAVFAADGDAASKDPTKYVELQGDWNFKLYRGYTQMYQYQPYGMCKVKWEDNELAKVPNADTFKEWETFAMPADDPVTGGLLPQSREDGSALFPTWHEAWVCRTVEIPADFTTEDTVTLLLGVIDDADVVYINGTAVASSGFINGSGETIVNDLELGGFDLGNVNFEKSYWEIAREYVIPTSCLKLGETNEICIRVFNNNSLGGFYSDRVYALCGNDTAVRYLKGLPYVEVEDAAVLAAFDDTLAAQVKALEANDMDAYAATVADNYNNDGAEKADRVAEMKVLLEGKTDIKVEDSEGGLYASDGAYNYLAKRVIKAGDETVFEGDVSIFYATVDGKVMERGNWNRCYTTSYYSDLFGKDLGYSVWLPPSYFTQPDREYPVVYLLHGQNSSSVSYLNVDNIGGFMDNLSAEGKIVDMIVIMPDSGKNAFYSDSELTDDGTNSGPWATQLSNELRLYVEANYRTLNDAKFRAMTGNSMGGGGTYLVGVGHPELYSSFASHMGWLPATVDNNIKALTPEQLAACDFYMDCGLQDTTVGTSGTTRVHELLNSLGKEDHFYELRDGVHGSAFYMGSMDKSMMFHSDHFAKYLCPFTDISSSGYYKGITDAFYAGIVKGYGDNTFRPNNTVTRAQFVTMLWRLAGSPVVENGKLAFADNGSIAADYANAIIWGVEKGIVKGYGDNTFRPNQAITRAQMATFAFRYASLPEVMGAPDAAAIASYGFVDEGSFDANYKDAINAMANLGVMLGFDKAPTFASNTTANRGMAATVVFRLMEAIEGGTFVS